MPGGRGKTQCRVGLDCVYHLFHLLLLGRAAQRLMTGLRRLSGMFTPFPMNTLRFIATLTLLALSLNACTSSTIPRRDPTGEIFPSIMVTPLDGGTKAFPEIYKGEPVLVLVGYQQRSQFDIDRWLIGITQVDLPVKFVELPTIAGMVPSLIGDLIDSGMRSGIPSELWGGVMTVYDDAELVQQFTGTENGLPSRVMLLDSMVESRVVYSAIFS